MSSYGVLGVFEQLAGRRKDFTAVHIKSTAGLLALQVGRQISLPYGLKAQRTYGGIFIGKMESRQLETPERRSFCPGETFFGKSFLPK